jgi:tRNA splicing endonuclease
VRLDSPDSVSGEVLRSMEEEVREERAPRGDIHTRPDEIAFLGLRSQHRARVVDTPEHRQPERRVDLHTDRVVRVLGGGARDSLVRAREDAVARRVEERAPAGAPERVRRAREIAGVLQEEIEVAHRAERGVRVVEEREDRALERDDLDAHGAQRKNDGPERLLESPSAGTRERDFCE